MTHLASALIWEVLLNREPELARLQADAAAVRDGGGPTFCANKIWYVSFEPRLKQLVGRNARSADPLMHTSEAYELAYRTLYRLLPNCRDCVCLPW
ncbi:MAG: hypothetical protein ACJ741_19620 [Pyrinomonadaceae bacterium]